MNKLLLISAGLLLTGCYQNTKPITSSQALPISAKFQASNTTIKLEVAKTPEQQATGLMYRTSLPDNRGMMFEFQRPRRTSFWMKNCKIPLDMIFVKEGIIQSIQTANPCTIDPCASYSPKTPVDSVIELRGGRAAELNLKAGDRIKIEPLITGDSS